MEKQRKLKVVILSTLIVGILTLTIAFSAMSRVLNIGGIGKMDTALWDVHFENLSDASIIRDAIEVSEPNISLDKGTVENINVKLTKPKDEIKYVVDIVNKGTIDAEVNVMTISDLTEEEKKLIDFGVYYLNGTKINKYDLLEPGDIKSIAIKIRYKDDITEEDLPSEPLEIKLSCQIEYVQSEANIAITTKSNLQNVNSVLEQGWNSDYGYTFWGGSIKKKDVESITFLSTLKVPKEASSTAWDASSAGNGSVVAWYTDLDNNGLYELNIGGNGKVYAPTLSNYLFQSFTNLKEINFNNVFDTSFVSNMYAMFAYCTSLTSIDLTSFKTSKVTNVGMMFDGCRNLQEISINNFNTSNVTNMSNMFHECNSLKKIDLSSFDTSNVTAMEGMFYRCRTLASLDLSNFNTSNVTNMSWMFYECTSLSYLNINNFNTINVSSMPEMFYNCASLSNINLSSFDTSNVTAMEGMFYRCRTLASLDLSNFNTFKVTSLSKLFNSCSSLTSLNLSSFDTSNVTNMWSMFSSCSSLTSLNLSSFDTSNVTTLQEMFGYCSSLTSLDLSNFKTENVTNMSSMFKNCTSLISLNLDGFNTESVTNMSSMFSGCSSLPNLNISSFETIKLTNIYAMFDGCTSLISLIFNDAVFDNVTNYTRMLTNVPKNFTIYVKDETAKEFILNIRSDANVIIGAPIVYNKDGLKNHLFLLHFFIIIINKYRR